MPTVAVLINMVASTIRMLAGLAIAAITSPCVGVLISYCDFFGKLVLPTVTLLTPVSPVAWLPARCGSRPAMGEECA
jgi:NitT/TauT family transport system permease protein